MRFSWWFNVDVDSHVLLTEGERERDCAFFGFNAGSKQVNKHQGTDVQMSEGSYFRDDRHKRETAAITSARSNV